MPDLKGLDNLRLILFFIVPGLISVFIRSKFIAGRSPSQSEQILSYLSLSVIYYAITLPAVIAVFDDQSGIYLNSFLWALLTLVGPAAFGFLLGVAAQKRWMHRILAHLELTMVEIIPTAWDYRFSKLPRDGLFVLVTLSDDRQIAGLFGEDSFASSDSGERDLYLEEEVTLDEDGQWHYRDARVGIFISAKEIKYVEFFDV